jgi:hypothetical protein
MDQVNSGTELSTTELSPRPALEEFFCHWLLRAYEAESRDTSYENGESLREVMRQINQVLGFAGYEPGSSQRAKLLKREFRYVDAQQVVQQAATDVEIVRLAREHVWEPENWESYERCKGTSSFSLPVEWFELCEAIEARCGAMPLDEPCDCGAKTIADHAFDCDEKPTWEGEEHEVDCRAVRVDAVVNSAIAWHQSGREGDNTWFDKGEALGQAVDRLLEMRSAPASASSGDHGR